MKMVKAAGFLSGMAQVIGIPLSTLQVVHRTLRGKNLITTGARGVNAPDMIFRDASRVLTWALVSDRPVDAAAAVEDFGNLQFEEYAMVTDQNPAFRMDGGHFEGTHTFEDALTELIAIFVEGGSRRASVGNCVVDVSINGVSAQIVMNDREHDYCYPVEGADMSDSDDPSDLATYADFIASEEEWFERRLRHAKKIHQYRSITAAHIEEIAKIFRESITI